ncbi:carph-isopro domain-containing protein [Methylobacterium sp. D54C]|jgi:hypothetical protein
MTPAERIIRRFGGIRPMASKLRDTPPSTIQGWMERGLIPIRRAPQIIAASRDLPRPVTAADFIPRRDADDPVDIAREEAV